MKEKSQYKSWGTRWLDQLEKQLKDAGEAGAAAKKVVVKIRNEQKNKLGALSSRCVWSMCMRTKIGQLRMAPIAAVAGVALLTIACGTFSGSDFIAANSRVYPPKAPDAEILVFFEGSPPPQAYEVIGLASAHKTATTKFQSAHPSELVDLLKREARKRGGDAIMDVRISPVEATPRTRKLGEAKVIVFVDQ